MKRYLNLTGAATGIATALTAIGYGDTLLAPVGLTLGWAVAVIALYRPRTANA